LTAENRSPILASTAILGSCILLGLVLGGWVQGAQIKAIKLGDRYVTVKGLVEREVKSDLAIWPVTFKEAGDDLPAAFSRSEADKATLLKFFAAQGISPQEITIGQIQVTDKQANEYGGNASGPRYIVQQTVTVQSSDVDKVERAGEKTADLVHAGIAVGGPDFGQGGIRYLFTGLNALKPDMITEATRNARASADRFAADSGSKVGPIRDANQGVFTITGENAGSQSSADENGPGAADQNADASLMKKVRVVATIDYSLIR
jgi:uncharacterized protein